MKKIGYFFYSFLPLLLALSMMFLFSIFAVGIGTLSILVVNSLSGTTLNYQELMQEIFNLLSRQQFNTWVSILFSGSGILVFGFWYRRQFRKTSVKSKNPLASFNSKILLALVLMVPALQILSGYLTSLVGAIFPSWLNYYEELLQSAGFDGKLSAALLLYAVVLGPVEEELIFRGVTLSAARRALPFWGANILQAFLFGAFHQNMIQGIYTFFVALFFGYIYHLTDSIYVSIFLHILFNTWGSFFSGFSSGGSILSDLSIIVTSILLLIFSLHLIKEGARKLTYSSHVSSHSD